MFNENNKLKVVSLFSGIGGFETGIFNSLGKENVEIVLASEINNHAVKGYEYIYKEKVKGDITKIDEIDVPEHNLLVAGFPCQAFSMAGKRLGFADTRGTLFFDVARIAKEKQPEKIILENVKGLVSHDNGRTLDIIIQSLNEIGYTVDFQVMNTKYFNLPQSRERIFIIALRDDLVKQEKWKIEGKNIIAQTKKRLEEYGVKTFNFNWPSQEKVNKKLKDILENKVDENLYINDELTEILVKEKGDLLPSYFNNNFDTLGKSKIVGEVGTGNYKANKRVYNKFTISPTITTACLTKIMEQTLTKENKNTYRIRKLTPLECFRLQGFPDYYINKLVEAGISKTQIYKMAGNSVSVNVIESLVNNLYKK
jgi:DNA (cytosine-5)-methyltransferase 1